MIVIFCCVCGLSTFAIAKPTCRSMSSPANWMPTKTSDATNPTITPSSTCAAAPTINSKAPPVRCGTGTTRKTRNVSSAPKPRRNWWRISFDEKIGNKYSIEVTRRNIRKNVSNCSAVRPKRCTALLCQRGQTREDPRREIGEERKNERRKEQQRERRHDDLWDERQRWLLDLRDCLEDRDRQADDHAENQHG